MSRYIDADVLEKAVYRSGIDNQADILTLIEDQPTADVEEVVRCRECAWWRATGYDPIAETDTGECQRPLGEFGYCETDENDYCSYGERRETDGDG